MADTVIRSRKDRAFLASIINDGDKIDYVTDKIEEAIATLGAQVIGELVRYRNVNRIFLVGGGAVLIEDAVRQAWPLSPERIEIIPDPQLALVREIALYHSEV